jgi:hypothetical protein
MVFVLPYFHFKACCLLFLLYVVSNVVVGADIVRMNTGNQPNDQRIRYKMSVLTLALEKTQDSYGDFEIKVVDLPTTAKRALTEVHSGKTINLFIGVTTRQWEEKNLPIRIPIRRGILSYRLLAVHNNMLNQFSEVQNIQDLKRLAAGVRVGWATTDVFKTQNLNLYELESLDGLYNMLNRQAIDYIPRGINEVYDEITIRQPNDIIVEPNLVLYLPAPTYIIVSPNEKRLAKRIEAGLEKMISDGTLKTVFYRFYADDIKKANIASRKIIRITNAFQPNDIPFDRPELWFNNDK